MHRPGPARLRGLIETGTARRGWLAGVFDRAAPTYDAVAGSYHDHFGARLVELADVEAGDTVLDVACGRGAVLIPAAMRAGPTGRVLGVDLSPEMVRLDRTASIRPPCGPRWR